MNTTAITAAPSPDHLPGRHGLARLLHRWQAWRRRANDRTLLLAMSELELRDVGLQRGDIEHWLAAPPRERR
ncbi:MAG TPA: DUF1127 domain-containing protein [Roseateles sp.]|nr:DUF1127 domain-containing protein [Roseateles sp.]